MRKVGDLLRSDQAISDFNEMMSQQNGLERTLQE